MQIQVSNGIRTLVIIQRVMAVIGLQTSVGHLHFVSNQSQILM
jgi:hypothetical protein